MSEHRQALVAVALLFVLAACAEPPAQEPTVIQPATPAPPFDAALYPWLTDDIALERLDARFPPPPGFTRSAAEAGSFAAWLRGLPLHPGRPAVHLHDGQLKGNQSAHVAVVAIDVGTRDLQQCADAVMRLRAEFLFASGQEDDVAFDFTSGDRAAWSAWRSGQRPRVEGNTVRWVQSAESDGSRANFRRYLDSVFTYAGSASLTRELRPVAADEPLAPGDVFIKGGFPGHAVIVLDVATDAEGRETFLLGQSYMPAQEIHVLAAPGSPVSPWYRWERGTELETPEWGFAPGSLRRF